MSENENKQDGVTHATDGNFDSEVLQSPSPVLVDFWAPWCGPCKAVAPILDEISAERADLRIVKVNVDDNPDTARRFNVRAIPTMLLFKDGEAAGTKIGAASKNEILEFIGEHA